MCFNLPQPGPFGKLLSAAGPQDKSAQYDQKNAAGFFFRLCRIKNLVPRKIRLPQAVARLFFGPRNAQFFQPGI
jgi:hypothetical protein